MRVRLRLLLFAACAAAILMSGAPALAQDPAASPDTLALVEELRIGSVGEGPGQFGRVSAVTVLESGDVWVADAQARTIKRFDVEGTLLGEVGRAGDGPGEFRSIEGMARLGTGEVAVWDPAAGRMSVFAPDGRHDRVVRLRGGTISYGRVLLRADTLDRAWVLSSRGPMRFEWVLHDREGREVATLPLPESSATTARWARQEYGASRMHPFASRTLATPSRCGYLVTGETGEYALEVRTPEGTRPFARRPWEPVPVDPAERRAFQAREDVFARRRGEDPGRVPSEKPAFWALWTDHSCRVWVSRHTRGYRIPERPEEAERRARSGNPPLEWWEDRVFDVFGPDGELQAVVPLPKRQTDLAFSEGPTLWVIEYGPYDEQYVVRYRMEGR